MVWPFLPEPLATYWRLDGHHGNGDNEHGKRWTIASRHRARSARRRMVEVTEKGESVPDIDWGRIGADGAISDFRFQRIQGVTDAVRYRIKTAEGREFDFTMSKDQVNGLLRGCAQVKQMLGF